MREEEGREGVVCVYGGGGGEGGVERERVHLACSSSNACLRLIAMASSCLRLIRSSSDSRASPPLPTSLRLPVSSASVLPPGCLLAASLLLEPALCCLDADFSPFLPAEDFLPPDACESFDRCPGSPVA